MISVKTGARGVVVAVGLLAVPTTAAATGTPPALSADLRATGTCAPVRATGVGQDFGGGLTKATISSHGVPLGTTAGTFTVTGQSGTIVSFEGPIVFTDRLGSIRAPVSGTLDVGTGHFRSSSRTVSGSGAYRTLTGTLTFIGNENLQTGAFTERVTGHLCTTQER